MVLYFTVTVSVDAGHNVTSKSSSGGSSSSFAVALDTERRELWGVSVSFTSIVTSGRSMPL